MKEHQTFRISKEILEEAKKRAPEENRSLSNFIENAVASYLDKFHKKKIKS